MCPVIAQELIAAEHDLGPRAAGVAFVGVNVNPKAESVAAMRQFTAAHGLTRLPNWHFLTGPARQLARVWAAYGIQVELSAPRTVTLFRTALRVGTQTTCAVLTENPLV